MEISFLSRTSAELWPYTVMVGAFLTWTLLCVVLVPAGWRDWAGVGVVQVFMTALYVEMYGYPLTLHFLAGLHPLKALLLHSNGHLWAALLGLGPWGATIEAIFGYTLLVAGTLLVVKGWVKVHRAAGKLVDDGVYGLIRHPQYLGIFLVILGGIVDWPTIPSLILAPIIVWLYVRLARREENRLQETTCCDYSEYKSRVPMFVPHRENLTRLLFRV
jgi:protein-S-isoprenylcysteine O-methyltransferase Ste14